MKAVVKSFFLQEARLYVISCYILSAVKVLFRLFKMATSIHMPWCQESQTSHTILINAEVLRKSNRVLFYLT